MSALATVDDVRVAARRRIFADAIDVPAVVPGTAPVHRTLATLLNSGLLQRQFLKAGVIAGRVAGHDFVYPSLPSDGVMVTKLG